MVTFASYRKVLPSMLKFFTVHSALRRNWMYASNMAGPLCALVQGARKGKLAGPTGEEII